MNDFLKKLLKSVVGLDDTVIEKIFTEGVEAASLDALIPEISGANRSKWEAVLLSDTKFTEPLTARGFSAGQAKAYQAKKDAISKALGLSIPTDSEDFSNNEKFIAKVKEHFDAQKKMGTGGNDEAIAKLKAEFEAQKSKAIEDERGILNGQFQQQLKGIKEDNILKTQLLTFAAGKKFKGGLSVDDLMPAIEAKTKGYKFEFDTERNAISKVLGLDGHEIDNETKSSKLTPSEILTNIFANFVDTEAQNTGGQGNGGTGQANGGAGQSQGDAANVQMNGYLSEMASMR
jgi:hypothetical protein